MKGLLIGSMVLLSFFVTSSYACGCSEEKKCSSHCAGACVDKTCSATPSSSKDTKSEQ